MTDWNPGPKYQCYLRRIQDLLTDEKRTVRDIYYALEARGFEETLREESYRRALDRHHADPDDHPHPDSVPDSEWIWSFEYRYVKRAVKKGRRADYLDPRLVIDASRRAEATVDAGYGDAKDFVDRRVRGVHEHYRENFWEDQSTYVEVWLEKQSLASVFEPICQDLNVRLEATRGDWSDSKVYEATQRLASKITDGNDVRVLYYGDFNPSGFHAPVSIQETMRHYGIELSFRDPDNATDETYFDIWPLGEPAEFGDGNGTLAFERRGINLDHIEEFELPENPNPSSTDKDRQLKERFQTHVSDGRDVNVELNALKEYQREYLEELIREGIEQHIDADRRRETERRVEAQREQVSEAVCIDEDALGGGQS